MSTCTSCNAPIRWATVIKSGRPMPLDAEPSDDGGNVEIVEELSDGHLRVAVLNRADAKAHEGPLYVSHFATCPNGPAHRKSK